MRTVLAALIMVLLAAAPAGAVTLEQYFGYSPKDRAMYLAGVLDLLIVDASREPEFRDCVERQGLLGMHDALIRIVEDDPRLLDFNAAIWILYEARRLCRELTGVGPVPQRPAIPESPAPQQAAAPAADAAPPAAMAAEPARATWGDRALDFFDRWRLLAIVLAAAAIGVLGGAVLAFVVRRRRRAAARPLPRILK